MPDDETEAEIPTASKTPSATDGAILDAECTCLAYSTPGSPSTFDDWTIDPDPYCPRHGWESEANACP